MKNPIPTKWPKLGRVAAGAVSLAALGLILRRVNLLSLGQTLAQANWLWVGAASAAFGIGFMMAAARWHLVLRMSQCQVHAAATAEAVLIGHLFNTLLFGPTGGDLAKSALYSRRYGFPVSTILATCIMDRFLGGLGLLIFGSFLPGFAIYSGQWSERINLFLTSWRLPLWGGGGLLLFLAARFAQRRFHWASPFRKMSSALVSNVQAGLRNPRLTGRAIIFAVASHLCISCVFLFSLKAVTHAPFSLAAIFWIFPVISVVTSAPLTVAGAGVREGAALFLLGLYGIPAPDAVAAALLVLLTYLIWAMLGGVLLWRAPLGTERGTSGASLGPISAVIPTLNEALALPETIRRARAVTEIAEIIVVDAGSSDQTRQIASELGCKVLAGPRSRGGQLRLGAAQASGEVILLLHADTWLPPNAGQALGNALRDPGVVAGGFWKVFREKKLLMAGSRFRCALRLLLFRRILGDQALFVRRDALQQIGGVPDVPLMEEFELCHRLRGLGRLVLAGATVTTSARRFVKRGILRTYFLMWQVTVQYYRGTSAQELKRMYEKD